MISYQGFPEHFRKVRLEPGQGADALRPRLVEDEADGAMLVVTEDEDNGLPERRVPDLFRRQ